MGESQRFFRLLNPNVVENAKIDKYFSLLSESKSVIRLVLNPTAHRKYTAIVNFHNEFTVSKRFTEELMNDQARTCLRCKEPLPDGTGYCTACGLDLDHAKSRQVILEHEVDTRIEIFRRFRGPLRVNPYFLYTTFSWLRNRLFKK